METNDKHERRFVRCKVWKQMISTKDFLSEVWKQMISTKDFLSEVWKQMISTKDFLSDAKYGNK